MSTAASYSSAFLKYGSVPVSFPPAHVRLRLPDVETFANRVLAQCPLDNSACDVVDAAHVDAIQNVGSLIKCKDVSKVQ